MFRDDYLLRMVHQLVDAIARIAGLNQRGEHDRALAAADGAWGELLGDIDPELATAVDSRTLAGLLRQPARIRLAHGILCEQARALAGKGDSLGAARRARRALELLLEARALEASQPRAPERANDPRNPRRDATDAGSDDAAAIRSLLQAAPAASLAARYRAMLPADR